MRMLVRSPLRRSTVAALLAVLLATLVPPAVIAAPVRLELKPPVGEELVYRVVLRAAEANGPTSPPSPIPLVEASFYLHLRIEAPDANGVYSFEYWIENLSASFFGVSIADETDSARRRGSIALQPQVKIGSIQEHPVLNEIGVQMRELIVALFPQYPEQPVQAGDRWSYTYELGDENIRRPVFVMQTLQSLNDAENTATLQSESFLEFEVEFDFDGVLTTVATAVRGQGTDIVDRTTGMLIRSTQENRETSLISDTLGYNVTAYFVTLASIERVPKP